MKKWVTVKEFRGYKIMILDGAEVGDSFDYKLEPPLPSKEKETYATVSDAIEAVEKAVYII